MNTIIRVNKICGDHIEIYERIMNEDEQRFIQNLMKNKCDYELGNHQLKK